MKKIYFTTLLLLAVQFIYAQFQEDALKFSRITNYGSARSAAMGGAFGALGGDLSTMSVNPAGIGVFRKSEMNLTPMLNFSSTSSKSLSIRWESERNSFQIGNMGFVLSSYNPHLDWRGFSIGFNYINQNNFNYTMDQKVENSNTSLLDVYSGDANLYGEDPFSSGKAYNVFLLNGNSSGNYESVLTEGEHIHQYKYIKEKGYQGEYAISIGTNYMDKLYLGMTLGLCSIEYKMNSTYSEYAEENAPSGLDHFNNYEKLNISGSGFNFKFGAIYRPIPQLRLGAAIHTPTWNNIFYQFGTDIESYFFTTDSHYERNELYYLSEYITEERDINLRTPWRAILSVASVLGQKAIISVDYEYVDYGAARFNNASDNANFHEINEVISSWYKSTHNFRVGAEFRVNERLSLRGGYHFMDTPYKDSGYSDIYRIPGGDKIQTFSGGIGLNFGNFYCDGAFLHRSGEDSTIFYYTDAYQADPVKNKYKDNQVRLSFGFRF